MPKHDILLKPGDKPTEEILSLLRQFFPEKYLTKLERFGGRIQINLAAPFTNRKQQNGTLKIDESFIDKLYTSKTNNKAIKENRINI
jgi:hypothetical protein